MLFGIVPFIRMYSSSCSKNTRVLCDCLVLLQPVRRVLRSRMIKVAVCITCRCRAGRANQREFLQELVFSRVV